MGRGTSSTQSDKNNKIVTHLHHLIRAAGLSTYLLRVDFIAILFMMRRFEEHLELHKKDYIGEIFYGDNDNYRFSRLTLIGDSEALQSSLNNEVIPFYKKLTKVVKFPKDKKPSPYEINFYKYMETFFADATIQKLKSGRLFEIISYIAGIEKEHILSDDFLGDIVESAFESQSGVEKKELGLFRTPKHIREMMVELVSPTIKDKIYDPACGTAGFLVTAKNYIQKNTDLAKLSKDELQRFFLEGLGGCEHDGFIHRFAMVIALTHGMNPLAIKEGDSLGLFDYAKDRENYDVILTNPPFGGKKNQDHYTNLWALNPSETTVLFLKLMYELLKMGGICASVVSEGMNTWNDAPSVEMRRILVEDCNLLAVISLPQGVFQSPKGGAGPKTSIYVFKKGEKTENVWFYQITNDGFSMGTNRKPIDGGQIPDLIDKWKKGRRENNNCYLIPKSKIAASGIYNLNIGNYLSGISQAAAEQYIKNAKALLIKHKYKPQIVRFVKLLQRIDWRYKDNIELIDKEARKILKEKCAKDIAAFMDGLLQRGHKYPLVKIGNLITVNENRISPAKNPNIKYTILGVSKTEGVFINEEKLGREIKQSYYAVKKNEFCYNPYRINVGSIGLNTNDIDNQIISGAYNVFGVKEDIVNPKFLFWMFKHKKFNDFVISKAHGGVRMDFKIDYMSEYEIPLPPLEIQNEVVGKIEKQRQIIDGAQKIVGAWEPEIPESNDKRMLKEFIIDTLYGISSPLKNSGKYPVLRMNNLDAKGNWLLDDMKYIDVHIPDERLLKKGDFIFNRTNSVALVGKSAVVDFEFSGTWAGYLIRLRFNELLNPYYLRWLFAQNRYREYFSSIAKPSGGQANINAEELSGTLVDYYPIEKQKEYAALFDKQSKSILGVQNLHKTARKRIQEILDGVWGG